MNIPRPILSLAKAILPTRCYYRIKQYVCLRGFRTRSGFKDFYFLGCDEFVPAQARGEGYHSQRGQDWFLDNCVFPDREDGFFLDIGANVPRDLSNTLFFESQGWQGLAFEPQPDICDLWKGSRSTPCFPLAVGDAPGRITLNRVKGEHHMVSYVEGVDPHALAAGQEIQQIQVEQIRLADFLAEREIRTVDFVSIDVEGYEMAVLQGMDFDRVAYGCLVIEHDAHLFDHSDCREFLRNKGYVHIARLVSDDVFVRRELLNGLRMPKNA